MLFWLQLHQVKGGIPPSIHTVRKLERTLVFNQTAQSGSRVRPGVVKSHVSISIGCLLPSEVEVEEGEVNRPLLVNNGHVELIEVCKHDTPTESDPDDGIKTALIRAGSIRSVCQET